MTDWTLFKHTGHATIPLTSRSPRLRDSSRGRSAVASGTTGEHVGVRDRALDGPAPKDAEGDRLVLLLLVIAARFGLSLFIAAGFAAGLCLYAGSTASDPNLVRACEGVFFWSAALISCVTGRRY